MSWTEVLSNPAGLRIIYDSEPPALRGVHLHEIAIHRDGPALRLRLDLPSYPRNPPPKWRAGGFTTVQITLELSGVRQLSVDGVSTDMTVDVEATSVADGVRLVLASADVGLRAVGRSLFVSTIGAYLDTPG
ncbi:Imm50 family immunity protein [Micromonospora sp. URMC 105]|uniref:Imm50 family immunity protein n=1 Tax=Micromonospora sp. URMC 105 TaxID=3423413 RepID=UPI003F1CA4EB